MPVVLVQLADALQHGMKVLLFHLHVFGEFDFLFIAAKGTLELLLPDVELQIGPAAFAGKHATFTLIDALTGRFSRALGIGGDGQFTRSLGNHTVSVRFVCRVL